MRSGAGRVGEMRDEEEGDDGNDTEDDVDADVETDDDEEPVLDFEEWRGCGIGFCCSYASKARRSFKAIASP